MKKIFQLRVQLHPSLKKLIMQLKIVILITMLSVTNIFASNTYSQTAKVTLDAENRTLEQVMDEIEQQSEFYFIFNQKQIDVTRTVNIKVDNKLIDEVLPDLFVGTDVNYAVLGRKILLTTDRMENSLLASVSITDQQQTTVTGTVSDAVTGEGMPGVNIQVKGTTMGTISDLTGTYSLSVLDRDATLIFSFIGYQTQEIPLNRRTTLNVALVSELTGLDEVVVIGYGTQKKEAITSSISSIKKENFIQGAIIASPLQLVQGKVAGLAIQRPFSDPNRSVSIQLRGISTVVGDNNPLIIIDGFPGGDLNAIAPENIESIDVLRDGSAASIYGTRGTNGVILITTKKGTEGRAEVSYSGYLTYEIPKFPDLLSADEYRELAQKFKSSDNSAIRAKGESMFDYGGNTDWFKEMTRNSISQVHNILVSGGSSSTTYSASLNYSYNKGILKRSGKDALRGRINIDHSDFDNRLKLNFNLSANSQKSNPSDYNVYVQALLRNPTLPVYNEDGTYYETRAWNDYNPVALIEQRDRDNQANEIIGSTRISYEILPGMTASVMGGLQKNNTINGYYDSKESAPSIEGGYKGNASRSAAQRMERVLESTINYSKLLNGIHRIEILGGYTYEDFINEGFSAGNSYFITDLFTYNNLGAGDYLQNGKATMSSYKNESKLIAFISRAIYSYKDKYLMTASLRREGSSKFGKENKWGIFPAISLGWRLIEEPFMQNINWLDDLKIRAGYGLTGNQGTDPYASLVRLTSGGRMLYNGTWIQGVRAASNPNPNLKWETKHEFNFGVDMAFLDKRISSSIDLYNRTTKDLIYTYSVPTPPNIYNETITNVGEISNKGIELSLNAVPIQTKDLGWNLDFNISYNVNKLVSLSSEEYPFDYKNILMINTLGLSNVYTYRLEEGKPIGNMYGYIFAGFDEDGKWLYYSKEGDIIPRSQATEDDKGLIGNGLPKMYSNLTSTFRYKNFDFIFMLRGVFKFNIYNLLNLTHQNSYQLPVNILDKSLDIELFDVPGYNSYYVEKGDFIKVDNLTLGYTFKTQGKFVKNARIYISGQNLHTFTDYSGVDPEVEINGLGPGFDARTGYPRTKTFSFGFGFNY